MGDWGHGYFCHQDSHGNVPSGNADGNVAVWRGKKMSEQEVSQVSVRTGVSPEQECRLGKNSVWYQKTYGPSWKANTSDAYCLEGEEIACGGCGVGLSHFDSRGPELNAQVLLLAGPQVSAQGGSLQGLGCRWDAAVPWATAFIACQPKA